MRMLNGSIDAHAYGVVEARARARGIGLSRDDPDAYNNPALFFQATMPE